MTSLFGSELRRARESHGWSRERLAEEINFSTSLIEKVEAGSKSPSESFAEAADESLGTEGLLRRIRRHIQRQDAMPEWFRSWPDIEEQATTLRLFELVIVPGLVQTEGYARALLDSDDKVAARLARQDIFAQDHPPEVVIVLDEAALRRKIGSAETMQEQLKHLMQVPACVQVLPADAGTYLGVDGSFTLATLDGREVAYVQNPARGFVLDDPEIASKLGRRWDTLRGEALPQRQSQQLIMKAAEEWMSGS